MTARIFLGFSALLWLPYGLFCFFQPSYLAEVAGVAASSPTGTIELRAMYGGLEAALGVLAGLAGLALFRPQLLRPALVTLAFVCSGLFLARLLGAGLGRELSSYTAFGLAFELVSAALAIWLLAHEPGLESSTR